MYWVETGTGGLGVKKFWVFYELPNVTQLTNDNKKKTNHFRVNDLLGYRRNVCEKIRWLARLKNKNRSYG